MKHGATPTENQKKEKSKRASAHTRLFLHQFGSHVPETTQTRHTYLKKKPNRRRNDSQRCALDGGEQHRVSRHAARKAKVAEFDAAVGANQDVLRFLERKRHGEHGG